MLNPRNVEHIRWHFMGIFPKKKKNTQTMAKPNLSIFNWSLKRLFKIQCESINIADQNEVNYQKKKVDHFTRLRTDDCKFDLQSCLDKLATTNFTKLHIREYNALLCMAYELNTFPINYLLFFCVLFCF